MINLESLIIRTACVKYGRLLGYLKVDEVRNKYYVKHRTELFNCLTDEEIHNWYSKQQMTMFRLFSLYTRDTFRSLE